VTTLFRHDGSIVGQGTVLFEVAAQPFVVLQGELLSDLWIKIF
jgi:hypothetical protein